MTEAADRRTAVLDRIAAAARTASRDPASVALIAVSKGHGVQEIEELIAAGQRDFGENRVQEAFDKWPDLLARHPDIRLHFVGRLQSNKAAEAVRLFDSIHSLDRPSLADALADAAARQNRAPHVYVQVNIGDEAQKGGCAIADLPALIAHVRQSSLTLAGLMAVPPQDLVAAPFFALLAKLAEREGVAGLSMGMSGDYPQAVMLGATAVRVGSALFASE